MSTAALERTVSQHLFVAALLERALHDEGPWTMSWGPVEVPAERTVHDSGVLFEATFPEACWLTRPEPCIVLRCRGEIAGLRSVADPGDAAFAVTWDLAAKADTVAGV